MPDQPHKIIVKVTPSQAARCTEINYSLALQKPHAHQKVRDPFLLTVDVRLVSREDPIEYDTSVPTVACGFCNLANSTGSTGRFCCRYQPFRCGEIPLLFYVVCRPLFHPMMRRSNAPHEYKSGGLVIMYFFRIVVQCAWVSIAVVLSPLMHGCCGGLKMRCPFCNGYGVRTVRYTNICNDGCWCILDGFCALFLAIKPDNTATSTECFIG